MEFTHGYRRVSGVGQRSAQQQAVLNDGGYNLHGGVEVGIGAAVFLGIAVVVPLAEDGGLYICNWQGHDPSVASKNIPQLMEIDKNGKIVWEVNDNKNFGMISSISVVK